MALKKICNKSGCNTLVAHGVRYCENHLHIEQDNEKERQRYYDKYRRDEKSKKFYDSSEWRKTRQVALIQGNYLCANCLENNKITPYDVVDHIVPIRADFSKRIELSNLRLLCHACHAIKTAEDKIKYNL